MYTFAGFVSHTGLSLRCLIVGTGQNMPISVIQAGHCNLKERSWYIGYRKVKSSVQIIMSCFYCKTCWHIWGVLDNISLNSRLRKPTYFETFIEIHFFTFTVLAVCNASSYESSIYIQSWRRYPKYKKDWNTRSIQRTQTPPRLWPLTLSCDLDLSKGRIVLCH